MLLILLAGIATAFNYLILAYKFKHKLWSSFSIDLISFITLNMVFLGTLTGMSIAMVASFIISVLTLPKPKVSVNLPKFKLPQIKITHKQIIMTLGAVVGSLAVLVVL